ncbi:S41 family peptidase [Abyssalbus ytuae]|uniref:S41 family peptidase n=1 Tax=Abyssalbus ytuae TaxID=2926907 RepID=A0A9E6ZZV7_9FLAO|nr:S41 family peptidase [Abyssalbus ytuae]UOB18217.1 S41 family peptidase [Abyssalbus ytuae]
MKNIFKGYFLITSLFFIGLFTSCSNDDDNSQSVTLNNEVNDFVWKGLNEIYLWQQDVPNLADNKFSSEESYFSFLNSYNDPESLFYDLLYQYGQVDKFSFIVDDYVELENSFSGISKSNGVDFRLGTIRDSNNVFGYVRYIVNNSDASGKDIHRGDFFMEVDGQQLTIDNYSSLLFGSNDTYTLGMATVENSTIALNGKTVELTKTELTENPILINKVLDIDGNKIGYLMYNSFIADFDNELNDVFGEFKAQGISDLVLDLRYNPGGRVSTAIYLSGMITGQFTDEIFSTEIWNNKYQTYFEQTQPDFLINKFTDKLSDNTSINSLNLNKVYILTTEGSASASELVINCLEPYIDIVHIGETTTGKYTASVTLYDSENFDRDNANPNHTYALQPLVLKSANANGKTDYYDGLTPDISIDEEITNMGILGETDEPYLAEAIYQITGISSKSVSKKKKLLNFKGIADVKDFSPIGKEMYIDLEKIKAKK